MCYYSFRVPLPSLSLARSVRACIVMCCVRTHGAITKYYEEDEDDDEEGACHDREERSSVLVMGIKAGFVVVMIGLSTSNLWIDRPMGKRVSVGGVVGE